MHHAEYQADPPDMPPRGRVASDLSALDGHCAYDAKDSHPDQTSGRACEEAVGLGMSYIEETAREFAVAGAEADREFRYRMRFGALVAKRELILNDRRALRAARTALVEPDQAPRSADHD